MFFGEHSHMLDTKGRIILPTEFRELLGSTFMINKGYDNCLCVYPMAEWERLAERLNQLPNNDKNARRVLRAFTSGAVVREADKQGRVVLPQVLRDYAGLTRDVVSIGVNTRIEIWDSEAWKEYNEGEDALNLEDAAQELPQILI